MTRMWHEEARDVDGKRQDYSRTGCGLSPTLKWDCREHWGRGKDMTTVDMLVAGMWHGLGCTTWVRHGFGPCPKSQIFVFKYVLDQFPVSCIILHYRLIAFWYITRLLTFLAAVLDSRFNIWFYRESALKHGTMNKKVLPVSIHVWPMTMNRKGRCGIHEYLDLISSEAGS